METGSAYEGVGIFGLFIYFEFKTEKRNKKNEKNKIVRVRQSFHVNRDQA